DGLVDDINWTTDTTTASANWNGFADSESGVVGYSVGLGTSIGSDDVVAFADVALATSYVFPLGAGLTEGTTYFATVRATNGVGLVSTLSSDGFTVDTAAPAPVTNLTISDVPGDNGGNVTVDWDPSTSVDEIAYRVDYHQVGGGGALSVLVGSATTANISGLENSPVEYEFEVVAIDFSTLESVGNLIVTGSALDNLAPELSSTKVAVAQNQPGTSDTISGIGGAASEPATVMVFDRDPSNPVKTTIASVATDANGGFVRVSLGDNLYGSVWVQLVDSAGNASTAKKFNNDIVGPAAPVITKATSTCFTERCQVELRWTSDNSDTDHYVIKYGSGVQVKTSLPVEGNSLVLDLPVDGSFQSFTVVAFDQFGNSTAAVKSFKASLVAGVVTTATLINGRLVTATSALPGSKETVTMDSPPTPAKLVPSAHAAEPDLDQTGDTEAAGDQDWLRIAIVVIILLIVASGFYSLSRSMGKNQLDIPAKPVKKKSGTSTKKPVGSNRQRHRKPKRK
ncbi:MAG: fibronectin type III domain-containing protein, partial [Patescibacteria group bacterium]